MKCYRCDRDMTKAAVSVPTKSGLAHLGPKCAILSGLIKPARRAKTAPKAWALFSKPRSQRASVRQRAGAGLIQGDLFSDPEILEGTAAADLLATVEG